MEQDKEQDISDKRDIVDMEDAGVFGADAGEAELERPPQKKILPKDLTSYDLLKTLALILMLADHVGYYFFPYLPSDPNPDVIWLRVLGRLSVPIWFFLIGYARTSEVPLRLLIWGVVAQLSELVSGEYILPLNILFTIAAARYVRDAYARKTLEKPEHMRGMVFLLLLGTFPTSLLVEYGSLVLFFVIYGSLRRNPEIVKVKPVYARLFIFLSFFIYYLWQGAMMGVLSGVQALSLAAGLGAVFLLLHWFEPREYPRLSRILGPFAAVLKLTGRRTLEIYVLHLIVFRITVLFLYPETYTLGDWSIADPGLMSMIVLQR
ncbi:MAG: hypothetical protein KDI90_08465 [Alphaproteobacteria bacterium]|nr:hypothetical protein [Alphaproteobacteria bacterium]MCB9975009.1 hypothetical protein [Rhodospirillales bacterium]